MKYKCFSVKKLKVLIFICSLQFLSVHAGENYEFETLQTKLQEIPKRLHQLSDIAFPDGIPEWFLNYYTLPFAPSEICRNHSTVYRHDLQEFQPWAIQMIDSSGKVPSGLMQYHLHDLGHFQECLNIDLENKSPYPVQHCVLQIGNLMRLPKAPHVDTETLETFFASLPVLKPRLHLGLCLPASCTQDDIKENYKQIVKKYNLTVHLENYSCTASNESQQFSTYDVIVSIVLAVPIILCVLATFIDSKFFTEGKLGLPKRMLDCFSLYKNGKNLLKTDSSKRPLSSLNGIRFLLMVWSTFTHHWMFHCVVPALNYSEMSKMFQKFYVSPILSGSLSVDTFILISGILLPYAFLHGAKKGDKFNLRKFYQHRIVRIVPCYFFLLLGVTANYGPIMCNGPLCKYYLTKQRENCFKNWWTNVLFINNYVNVESQCLGHTWYLATDIQLRLIAPIFLLAFFKYKSLIKFGIPICIVIGCIIAFSTSFINQFSAGTLLPVDFRTVHKFWKEHITTHNKLGPWFVGMGLGYILFESEEKRFKIPSFVAKLCWVISILVGGTVLMSMMYFHQDDVPYNRLMSSSYSGLHSTLWCLSVAWVILALETGHGDLLRKIFAWKVFQPLAKLVFTMYLLHPILQYETNALRKTSAYTEITFLNMTILGELFTLILILPVFTLIYEIPFICLEKVLLDHFKNKKKEIDDNTDTQKIGLSKI